MTSQLTYPGQFPRHLTKRDTKWNHQDLQGVRNTIIHAQGHAPGTVNGTENAEGVAAGAKSVLMHEETELKTLLT